VIAGMGSEVTSLATATALSYFESGVSDIRTMHAWGLLALFGTCRQRAGYNNSLEPGRICCHADSSTPLTRRSHLQKGRRASASNGEQHSTFLGQSA
jgi:hypothetical protein